MLYRFALESTQQVISLLLSDEALREHFVGAVVFVALYSQVCR